MTEFKPTKGWLGLKVIPVNKKGDPEFTELGIELDREDLTATSVLSQFTPEEVTYLVNKQLYTLAYQRDTHRKRAAEERELLAPVIAKFKEQNPGQSWAKATEEQIAAAVNAVKAERRKE